MPANTANTKQTQQAKPAALVLERTFTATPTKLWSYFVDPAKYAKWLNPAPIDLVVHEWDVRVGGRIRFDMPQPDGNPNPQEGTFHVVDAPHHLVSGSPDKSFLIDVRLAPVDDAHTRMTITVTGVPSEYHAMAREGWGKGLDKLERLATTHRAHGKVVGRHLELERFFRAPPEKVFAAWGDAKLLPKFFWPVGTGVVKELSFKPGGKLVMGHTEFPDWLATWRFTEIVPGRKIALVDVWPDGSGAEATGTMEFIPQNGGTLMKVRHGPFPTEGPYQPEGAATGFTMVADRLAEEVETAGEGGFELVRFFRAPPERVWKMWTTKEGLEQWWLPSAKQMGYEFAIRKLDVRVGGGYDIVLKNKQQGELHNHGVYTEVIPNQRFSQRWDFDIFLPPGEKPYIVPITVELEEVPTMDPKSPRGTKMTFTQGPMKAPGHTEGSRQGVIQNLGYLRKALGE